MSKQPIKKQYKMSPTKHLWAKVIMLYMCSIQTVSIRLSDFTTFPATRNFQQLLEFIITSAITDYDESRFVKGIKDI